MQAATVHQLRKEMELLDKKALLDILNRLAKFKKENKELLTYLLFEATNEERFREMIKGEISELISGANRSNIYWTKKTIRKTLRYLDKIVRFSGSQQTEVELRLHFLSELKENRIPVRRSRSLYNLYERQIVKVNKVLKKLHEDLQYDYGMELEEILGSG